MHLEMKFALLLFFFVHLISVAITNFMFVAKRMLLLRTRECNVCFNAVGANCGKHNQFIETLYYVARF